LNEPVLYASFETDEETMMDRLIAMISGVETDKLITGFMTKEEVEAAQEAAAILARSPLVFTQRGRTLQELMTIIRHDRLKRGTKVAIVDYLQLMRVEGWRDRRDLELGEISSQLLQVTRELDMRVIAQAQLNREGAKSEHQTKEHTGDSYRLAQDADEYLILRMKSKEEKEEDGPQKGDRFALLDKNRGGRRGIGFSVMADESVMLYSEAR
jgi:replicative DNA helicase